MRRRRCSKASRVEYYGAKTPLNQLAGLSAPEPRLLLIQPYDRSVVNDIERAILQSDLGLVPQNDGKLIRVPIPELTEERRRDLVKHVRKVAEEYRVSLRNHRRDANELLKELEKDGEITQDELHRGSGEDPGAHQGLHRALGQDSARPKKTRSWRCELVPALDTSALDLARLPRHVAVIMDGNGRWAQRRGLSRIEGHRRGKDSVRAVVETARRLGIPYLSLFAFSTENWQRPRREVDAPHAPAPPLPAHRAEQADEERGARARRSATWPACRTRCGASSSG